MHRTVVLADHLKVALIVREHGLLLNYWDLGGRERRLTQHFHARSYEPATSSKAPLASTQATNDTLGRKIEHTCVPVKMPMAIHISGANMGRSAGDAISSLVHVMMSDTAPTSSISTTPNTDSSYPFSSIPIAQ